MKTEYHVFLGGKDQEMEEIKRLAEGSKKCVVHDAGLSWGAKASAYKEELNKIINRQNADMPMEHARALGMLDKQAVPVLIELALDVYIPKGSIIIDHHGDRAGEPPALIQFMNLVGIKPTRKQRLIGAHDAAWVPGLITLGATEDEIAELLGVKNRGQTIGSMMAENTSKFLTPDEIAQAKKAVRAADLSAELIYVECEHSKCGLITAMCYSQQHVQNVLIVSKDGEVNYYGTGKKVLAVADKFPGGWSGGAGLAEPTEEAIEFWGGNPPNTAFWGCSDSADKVDKIISVLSQLP